MNVLQTYIVPCWEGTPLPDATLILRLGGKHVTDRLLHLLSNGKYSFSDDTFLLWKRGGRSKAGSRLTVYSAGLMRPRWSAKTRRPSRIWPP